MRQTVVVGCDKRAVGQRMCWLFMLVFFLGQTQLWLEKYLSVLGMCLLLAVVLAVEVINYSYRRLNLSAHALRLERQKYLAIIGFIVLTMVLDDCWRSCGGTKEYFSSCAGQQMLFFVLMPSWLIWRFSKLISLAISAAVYVVTHLPNLPLFFVTFSAAFIFVFSYSRWGWKAFFLMAVLHFFVGSFLHEGWGLGWNMRVGISYLAP